MLKFAVLDYWDVFNKEDGSWEINSEPILFDEIELSSLANREAIVSSLVVIGFMEEGTRPDFIKVVLDGVAGEVMERATDRPICRLELNLLG